MFFPLIRPLRNLSGALIKGNIPDNIGLYLSADTVCLLYVLKMIAHGMLSLFLSSKG